MGNNFFSVWKILKAFRLFWKFSGRARQKIAGFVFVNGKNLHSTRYLIIIQIGITSLLLLLQLVAGEFEVCQ